MRPSTRRSALGAASALACVIAATGLAGPAHADATVAAPAAAGVTVPLASAGTIVTWGKTAADDALPDEYANVPFTSVATSNGALIGRTATGQIVTWGSAGDMLAPIPTALQTADVRQLAAQVSGLVQDGAAVTADGHVTAWQGDGATADAAFTDTSALSGVSSISLGSYASAMWGVALKSDGTIAAWGTDNSGDVSGVPDLTGVTQVTAGGRTGYAVTADGAVHVWGYNGVTNNLASTAPTSGVVKVVAENAGAYALKTDGSLYKWGASVSIPTDLQAAITAGTKIVGLEGGHSGNSVVALDDTGKVWMLGSAGTTTAGQPPAGLDGTAFVELASSGGTSYALSTSVLPVGKPTIAGTAKVGVELEATDTEFSGGATVTGRQWYRKDGSTLTAIPDATSTTYTPTSADVGKSLVYRDTATPTSGEPVTADSDPTATVASTGNDTVTPPGGDNNSTPPVVTQTPAQKQLVKHQAKLKKLKKKFKKAHGAKKAKLKKQIKKEKKLIKKDKKKISQGK